MNVHILRDTLPAPPPPSRAERDKAYEAALGHLADRERIAQAQVELIQKEREALVAYHSEIDKVLNHDLGAA